MLTAPIAETYLIEEQRNTEQGTKLFSEFFRFFFLCRTLFLTQELQYHIEDSELQNNICSEDLRTVIWPHPTKNSNTEV